ncbi:hypothetical protein [Ruania alba]|uniref:hypothetical protein n=1 Tax=Ruania alba TaxID=648782 RepID=UPI00111335DF|nr:hypothetical protein [Ruania alba]
MSAERAADPGPDVHRRHGDEQHREPEAGERIERKDERITLLPDPEDVFAADQRWLGRVLHPLVSIDLSAIDPAWSGRVRPRLRNLYAEATRQYQGTKARYQRLGSLVWGDEDDPSRQRHG